MTATFIADTAVDLPVRFTPGMVLDDLSAYFLNKEFVRRVAAQLRWKLARGEIAKDQLLDEAESLSLRFIFNEENINTTDEDKSDDPIFVEAMSIAREMITKELAEAGVTTLPNLENHAKALVDTSPIIREKARERVELRWKMAQEAISKVGV